MCKNSEKFVEKWIKAKKIPRLYKLNNMKNWT